VQRLDALDELSNETGEAALEAGVSQKENGRMTAVLSSRQASEQGAPAATPAACIQMPKWPSANIGAPIS